MKSKFFVLATLVTLGLLFGAVSKAMAEIPTIDRDVISDRFDDIRGIGRHFHIPTEPSEPSYSTFCDSPSPPAWCGEVSIGDPARHDADGDSVADVDDNCPSVANADQADADGDDIGDACDSVDDRDPDLSGGLPIDTDGDTVADVDDLCVDTPAGAAVNEWGCPDTDADGLFDDVDNCVAEENADQIDTDGDGIGDACDTGSASTGGGCSSTIVNTGHASNVVSILILAISIAPLAIRRKRMK